MSNVCCKECSGWVKSFTKVERALALLEAILLVVLVVLLILLILHLIACSNPAERVTGGVPHSTTDDGHAHTSASHNTSINDSEFFPTTKSEFEPKNGSNAHSGPADVDKNKTNTEAGVQCSWTPSVKTTAGVHYYEDEAISVSYNNHSSAQSPVPNVNVPSHTNASPNNITAGFTESPTGASTQGLDYWDELTQADQSDGEEAKDEFKNNVVALVKLKPPKDVIFGCILTIVTEYWTLTAASCIEAIEEVDSLDSFVIMEQYGSNKTGALHTIEDVQIHPLYEGRNKTYDLAALRSGRSLTKTQGSAVQLASILDYALTTIGERFTILGYGAYRSIDKSASGRALRAAAAYRVPARQCATHAAAALRHLGAGRAVTGAACGTAALCCGALWARALPCNYCSGTPLLRGARLLGIMADNPQCGVACDPRSYVNIAVQADWIRRTVASEEDNQ